jgi:ABC-type multidrug transport system permease subunit
MAAADPAMVSNTATAHTVQGAGTGYIDWLFPGILGMNMMFSALFGVGYMVVLYRKNGVLRRFAATPLTPFEFLASQVASRLVVIVVSTAFVFVACLVLFGFSNQGNYLSLIVFASLGACSHIALALLIAARSSSEEFASGLLNIIAWPMMFLSEVWFSLEGAPPWVQKVSAALPLTHLVGGMRAILNEGASLFSLGPSVAVLVGYTAFFMAVGSAMFRWTKA